MILTELKGKAMGSQLMIAALAAGIGFSPLPSEMGNVTFVSGDCSSAESKVIAQTKGKLLQVLSTVASGNTCVVTILVQENGGRPLKKTIRMPM